MIEKKENTLRVKNGNKLTIISISMIIGIIIGIVYSRYHWASAAEYYYEMKHQYNYCPYCGEYLHEK